MSCRAWRVASVSREAEPPFVDGAPRVVGTCSAVAALVSWAA
jgi:hypothetical protein